jgi:hypothetical protein
VTGDPDNRDNKQVTLMRYAASLVATLVLVALIPGCGCLAANAYDQPSCQKYHTNWDEFEIYNEE